MLTSFSRKTICICQTRGQYFIILQIESTPRNIVLIVIVILFWPLVSLFRAHSLLVISLVKPSIFWDYLDNLRWHNHFSKPSRFCLSHMSILASFRENPYKLCRRHFLGKQFVFVKDSLTISYHSTEENIGGGSEKTKDIRVFSTLT